MIFGERKDDTFYFNGRTIEIVEEYKYLEVMISSINYRQKDVFATNHQHLCDKARRAVCSMYKKTKCIGTLPMKIVFHLFQHLIQPILLYGSEIWGISDHANSQIDTFFNCFLRCALGVKPSTSTAMIFGCVDRYRLVYGRMPMCWHIMPVSITCRTLQWWNKYITSCLN